MFPGIREVSSKVLTLKCNSGVNLSTFFWNRLWSAHQTALVEPRPTPAYEIYPPPAPRVRACIHAGLGGVEWRRAAGFRAKIIWEIPEGEQARRKWLWKMSFRLQSSTWFHIGNVGAINFGNSSAVRPIG